jgi:hypothetical protein
MELLSKDNEKFRKQNEVLKDMITKFIPGEYSKERLIQKYQEFIDKDNKV